MQVKQQREMEREKHQEKGREREKDQEYKLQVEARKVQKWVQVLDKYNLDRELQLSD